MSFLPDPENSYGSLGIRIVARQISLYPGLHHRSRCTLAYTTSLLKNLLVYIFKTFFLCRVQPGGRHVGPQQRGTQQQRQHHQQWGLPAHLTTPTLPEVSVSAPPLVGSTRPPHYPYTPRGECISTTTSGVYPPTSLPLHSQR